MRLCGLFAAIFVLAFTACEDIITSIGEAMLVNTPGKAWISTENTGYIFKSDGTVDMVSEVFLDYWQILLADTPYTTDGNRLTFGIGGGSTVTYKVSETTLMITNRSTNVTTTYTKRDITLNDLKIPTSSTALTEGQWKDDNFVLPPGRGKMYSFPVTSNQKYYVWWNEEGVYGDNTKTQDVTVYPLHSNKTPVPKDSYQIPSSNQWYFAWDTSNVMEFTASANGTMYLWVTPAAGSTIRNGTFAIVYSTSSDKPVVPPTPSVDPALNGTWVYTWSDPEGVKEDEEQTLVLNNGVFTMIGNVDDLSNVEVFKGTYSTSGNSITIIFTQVSGAIYGDVLAEIIGFSTSQWYTQEEFRTTYMIYYQTLIEDETYTQDEAEAIVDEIISGMFSSGTATYTLSGNTLTFYDEDGEPTGSYTRQP